MTPDRITHTMAFTTSVLEIRLEQEKGRPGGISWIIYHIIKRTLYN